MRLGVLDVGSNTIHLQVIDGYLGGPPIPNSSHKSIIRLTEYLDEAGSITEIGVDRITDAIAANINSAEHLEIDELLAFATSAISTSSVDTMMRSKQPLSCAASIDQAMIGFP